MNNINKNLVCLICGENISFQIDLNKQTISTDCKNRHHCRQMLLNDYYKFLPSSTMNEYNKNNEYIFYCFICQKNINLVNIEEHNRHDGIKLSINEFLDKTDCISFNKNILNSNFNKELNEIEKIINDYKEWKIKFDKRFNILIEFYENIYQLEKNIFNSIFIKNKSKEYFYYDYELLTNIKEIYRINKEINIYRRNYEGLFINNNYNKLSYFIINKINDINEQNEISYKDIKIYYQDNKCFFNEEIYYKQERKDSLFPYINNLFQYSKHMVGYDSRYFEENCINQNVIKFNNKIFQEFLQKIRRKYPKINHLSLMRDKSYFLCSIENKIIIIKTNIFNIQNFNDFKMEEIIVINSFNLDDLSNIFFSIELSNRLLLGISEKYIYIYESLEKEDNNSDNLYKNYFIYKNIKIKNKINDIIQISQNFFCTYSVLSREIDFYDISNMEIVTKLGEIEGTPGGSNYITMIKKDLLLFAGTEKIILISIISMDVIAEIRTTGLVSSFCLLPNNGLLCGEIIFDYTPNNPWKKGNDQFNLVQYQINDNNTIKKVSEKINVHKDIIRSIYYFENNIILTCSNQDDLKIWY